MSNWVVFRLWKFLRSLYFLLIRTDHFSISSYLYIVFLLTVPLGIWIPRHEANRICSMSIILPPQSITISTRFSFSQARAIRFINRALRNPPTHLWGTVIFGGVI